MVDETAKPTIEPNISGKKTGRPRIKIDWDEFDKLCGLHCTLTEIASFFNCSEYTIERAVKREKKVTFAEHYKQKTALGRISLRRMQWKQAESGNTTMLIWLGKQELGQSDKSKSEITGADGGPVKQEIGTYDPITLRRILSSQAFIDFNTKIHDDIPDDL